jgi:hypothetical protein
MKLKGPKLSIRETAESFYNNIKSITKLYDVSCVLGEICQSVKYQKHHMRDRVNMKSEVFLLLRKQSKCNYINSQVLKCLNVSSDKNQSYQLYKLESRGELSKTE